MPEFAVKVTWVSQDEPYKRKGTLSAAGMKDIPVVTPPEFDHGIPNEWSPEHLFVASVSACTMATFLKISENSKLDIERFSIESKGVVDEIEVEGTKQKQVTTIHVKFFLKLKNPVQKNKAKKILEMTERDCLIAHSMKSKVTLEPVIE